MLLDRAASLGVDGFVEPDIDKAAAPPLQTYLDFEVYVAAGQVWLAMPGHADCRAMYPDHARALAAAMEQIAGGAADRTIFLAQDISLLIHAEGTDLVLIREENRAGHKSRNCLETCADAARLARRVRDAADRAERGMQPGRR